MSKFSITDEGQLSTLDAQLKDNLYIGGNFPNADDATLFEEFTNAKSEPNQDKHLNLWSWFALINIYTKPVRESWKTQSAQTAQPAQKGGKTEKPKADTETKGAPKPEAKKAEDDVDDLFADEPVDQEAIDNLKKKNEEKKKEKKHTEVIAKSLILLDVKVWDPEQDYDALAKKILTIEKDGLVWKTEYQLRDVAFGVKKIAIGCVVEDEKVSVDDIIDQIQSWEDDVQSVDIVAFNKI